MPKEGNEMEKKKKVIENNDIENNDDVIGMENHACDIINAFKKKGYDTLACSGKYVYGFMKNDIPMRLMDTRYVDINSDEAIKLVMESLKQGCLYNIIDNLK